MNKKYWFTLIEITIVIVIIAILAAGLIPRIVTVQSRARDTAREVDNRGVASALEVFYTDNWSYPHAVYLTRSTQHQHIIPQVFAAESMSTLETIKNDISKYVSSVPSDPSGKGLWAREDWSCVIAGRSYAYFSNTIGSEFAITMTKETKKWNTNNCEGNLTTEFWPFHAITNKPKSDTKKVYNKPIEEPGKSWWSGTPWTPTQWGERWDEWNRDTATDEKCFITSENSNGTKTIINYKNTEIGCSNYVTIPAKIDGKSVVAIWSNSFLMKAISEVRIPSSVISIESSAFSYNNLSEVVLLGGVKSVGNSAFSNNMIERLSLPWSLDTIGNAAFANNNLSSVSLTSWIKTIGSSAFADNKLKSVSFPQSITSIKSNAFKHNSLTSLIIPYSVDTLEGNAFENNGPRQDSNGVIDFAPNNNQMRILVWQNWVKKTIGVDCFQNTTNTLTSYDISCGKDVVIPSEIGGYMITNIAAAVFNNKGIDSVIIPNTITTIWNYAFQSNNLTSVSLPESIVSLWHYTFRNNHLKSIALPSWISYIGISLLENNDLTSITIKNGPDNIYENAFTNNNLTELRIPRSIATIASIIALNNNNDRTSNNIGNFITNKEQVWRIIDGNWNKDWLNWKGPNNCFGVDKNTIVGYKNSIECPKNVTIPGNIDGFNITVIWDSAFKGLDLTWVTFSSILQVVQNYAFMDNKIEDLDILSNVIYLGAHSFTNNKLSTLNIPWTVDVAGGSFSINNITSVVINTWITAIGNGILSSNKLTTITFPNTVNSMNGEVVWGNGSDRNSAWMLPGFIPNTTQTWNLSGTIWIKDEFWAPWQCFKTNANTIISYNKFCDKNVIIPDTIEGYTITTIGDHAFSERDLTSVIFPETITTIWAQSFRNNHLTGLILPDSITTIWSLTFASNNLSSVKLSKSLKRIESYMFTYNNISSLEIPEWIEVIGIRSFYGNSITSLTLPESVQAIWSSAFFLNNITSLSIGSNVNTLDAEAFKNNGVNKNSKNINFIPNNQKQNRVINWTDWVLRNNDSCFLVQNNTITSYKNSSECSKNVTIPGSIEGQTISSIGNSAFSSKWLTGVTLPNTITNIAWNAFANNEIVSLVIPEWVVSISNKAFDTNLLTGLHIPQSVILFEWDAFAHNGPNKDSNGIINFVSKTSQVWNLIWKIRTKQ